MTTKPLKKRATHDDLRDVLLPDIAVPRTAIVQIGGEHD
jgi:hypothetical protein